MQIHCSDGSYDNAPDNLVCKNCGKSVSSAAKFCCHGKLGLVCRGNPNSPSAVKKLRINLNAFPRLAVTPFRRSRAANHNLGRNFSGAYRLVIYKFAGTIAQ
jgi:hypothetical protein